MHLLTRPLRTTLLSILLWFAIAGFGTYLLGFEGMMVATLAVATSAVIFQRLHRLRLKRMLGKIAEADERFVRFDGNLAQGQVAIDIGTSNGWIAQIIPQDHPKKLSVRFEPGESTSTARNLVHDLFEAGIAGYVRT